MDSGEVWDVGRGKLFARTLRCVLLGQGEAMNYCQTCKYWKPSPDEPSTSGLVGGLCDCTKITEVYGFQAYNDDSLTYEYCEDGTFWVGPKFGCVHHLEKP